MRTSSDRPTICRSTYPFVAPLTIALWIVASSAPLLAVQRHILKGHVPAAVAQVQPVGALPDAQPLDLSIGLPLRNREELTGLLEQIYDPAHPNYRRFLTPEQFTERFGPTQAEYDRVMSFARTNGLQLTARHANRLVLGVRGTVADLQRAFHIRLGSYPHPLENRLFYAPDQEPSVDADVPILDIAGFNNFSRPHPKSLRKEPLSILTAHRPKGGSGPNGNYMGGDFRAAYLPGVSLTGTGQMVGLLEFDGHYTNDITLYESRAGLPRVPVETVLLAGYDGTPSSGNSEVALDIEVAIAMAPGLSKVLVYEAGPDGHANDILSRMASDNSAAQLSCSWYFGGDYNGTTEELLLQFAAQGQTFFDASGDDGAHVGTIPSPDDHPYITIVGGTTLTTSGPGGSWVSETTWNTGQGASTGGFSSTFPIPGWQLGLITPATQGSTTYRNVPDVALVADNVSIVADNGQQYPIAGTSASAPMWAGFIALANQYAAAQGYPRIGFLNSALYSLARGTNYVALFHDVTSGNNTNSTTGNRFSAQPGYDLCTGWGSPTGQSLLAALAVPDPLQILPLGGFDGNGPTGGPFTMSSQAILLTNAGGGSLSWALAKSATWVNASPAGGTLAAGQTAPVTITFDPSANDLTSGQYAANLLFTNLTSQVVQTRQVTLAVGTSLLPNGGFESGDFSYWILGGNSASSFNSVDDGSTLLPHSGNYSATFGELGELATVSQTITTLPGQTYLLSFWFTSVPDSDNVTTPNEFRVRFDNHTLMDSVNLGILDWTNAQFFVTATGTSAVVEFGLRDDPYFLGLDDVTLVAVPAPNFQSISQSSGLLHFSWRSLAGLSYQVQYRTDLNQPNWINLGVPVKANDSSTSATDTTTAAPARYYRIVLAR